MNRYDLIVAGGGFAGAAAACTGLVNPFMPNFTTLTDGEEKTRFQLHQWLFVRSSMPFAGFSGPERSEPSKIQGDSPSFRVLTSF